LREEITAAFVAAFNRLRRQGRFKTSFIEYIPEPEAFSNDPFLQYIAVGIIRTVIKQNIFLSRGGNWISPEEAFILPPEFIMDGEPLFSEEELNTGSTTKLRYLSSEHYTSPRSRKVLKILNVREFSHASVERIVTKPEFFCKKPDEWFSRFFTYLYRYQADHGESSPVLRLPFLKLADDTWVPKSSDVLFRSHDVAVPRGLGLQILDRNFWEAVTSNDLATNFLLGVPRPLERLTLRAVIKELIRVHIGIESGELSLTHDELVEQAKYLCLQQLPPDQSQSLKSGFHLSDAMGRCTLARHLVRDRRIEWSGGVYYLSSIESEAIRFLHQDYAEETRVFIDRILEVPKLPPLIQYITTQRGWRQYLEPTLSTFYITDLSPSLQQDNKLLYLLAEVLPKLPGNDRTFACDTLKNIEVVCDSENPEQLLLRPLHSCVLRTIELEPLLSSEFNVLSLENPNHPKWSFLDHLGVTSRPNVQLYLEKLVLVRQNGDLATTRDRIVHIVKGLYEGLQRCNNFSPSDTLIQYFSLFYERSLQSRAKFNEHGLLVVNGHGEIRWARPKDLCLEVPPFARHTPRYPPRYPRQPWSDLTQTFILEKLDIPLWDDAKHLLPEIRHVSAAQREWNATCSDLFTAFKRAQKNLPKHGGPTAGWIRNILELPCFPVVRKNNNKVICCLTPEIFVLDSPSLNTHFKGKIDVLDFGTESVYALRQLLKEKVPDDNFLSFYDNDSNVEIPEFIDFSAIELQRIREKERYITR
jgi:hypothetical protein